MGGDPYLVKNEFNLVYERVITDDVWGVEDSYTNYDPDQDGFFYLEGYSNNLRAYLRKDLGDQQVSLGVSFLRERYVDSVEVNRSYDGVSLDGTYLKILSKKWEFELGLGITKKRYLKDFNSTFTRQDTYSAIGAAFSYSYSSDLTAYVSLSINKNKSNLNTDEDNRNYTQAVSLVGITWRIY